MVVNPLIRRAVRTARAVRMVIASPPYAVPGHFYSPLTSRAGPAPPRGRVPAAGVDLREAAQLELCARLRPWLEQPPPGPALHARQPHVRPGGRRRVPGHAAPPAARPHHRGGVGALDGGRAGRAGRGPALLLAPLLGLIALVIRLADGGPALFRQTRVGKDGRPFTVLKFRTMVPDAEQRKAALAGLSDADSVLFKIQADPRVTRVGRWLRRWSLDELPQLLNVLLGEMSLVGPRPALPDETERYADHVRRRLVVKPGITGLWQVNGRSGLSWKESVRLDLRYVENWSLGLDLQILWQTRAAVLRRSGAY